MVSHAGPSLKLNKLNRIGLINNLI